MVIRRKNKPSVRVTVTPEPRDPGDASDERVGAIDAEELPGRVLQFGIDEDDDVIWTMEFPE